MNKIKRSDINFRVNIHIQLCIASHPCNDPGSYFVPDFIAVKKSIVNDKEVIDIIVIDTKLTIDTDFTANQKKAMTSSTYTVRSDGISVNIPNGESFRITQGSSVNRTQNFIKGYSEGNGTSLVGFN
jgi:hypothetical protein